LYEFSNFGIVTNSEMKSVNKCTAHSAYSVGVFLTQPTSSATLTNFAEDRTSISRQ